MSRDRNFHYNFDSEQAIKDWSISCAKDGLFQLKASFTVAEPGHFALVFDPRHSRTKLDMIDFKLNDQVFGINWQESEIAYVAEENSTGLRYAFKINLTGGCHNIKLRLRSKFDDPAKEFKVTLIPELKAGIPERYERIMEVPTKITRTKTLSAAPDLKTFTHGIGTGPCAGRFGFTKGDGVLDCAMPILGIIDKMYLCGHPKYLKPYKWTISVLPFGIDPVKAYHGSFAPAQVGIEKDEITVNHLSVNWKTSFYATEDFFERKTGKKVNFACTYSLGSAGILVESSDPGISLSMLEYAGNYQYLLIPQTEGIKCASLSRDFVFDGNMSENWMLLFGATEFPDLPILLVFEKTPTEIKVKRNASGRLSSLNFHIPPKEAKMFVSTPFGIESLQLTTPDDKSFILDAVERCRFWSRAFLAYPMKCKEYYKLNEENEKVEIIQKFDYRIIKDQWRTEPLKTAPRPPVLSMLDGTDIVEFDPDVHDFKFPTKYGFLKGAVGKDSVFYKIPYMPRERKFPMKDRSGDAGISELLAEDLESYFKFHEQFKPDQQAYPYAGSGMEPYAWAAPLFNFMDKNSREKLAKKTAERLTFACDPDRQYVYPIIVHSDFMREMPGKDRVLEIYRNPEMRYQKLYNWYDRKEPFTGAEYRICYLNAYLFSGGTIKKGTREEVAKLKMPLIENDWGAGLAFYYMYLCALASGSFKVIKENWTTICDAYKYFEKLHDWACMGTAYSDNGISWVEGANYGVFTSFVNMAEAIGEDKSYAKGVYIAAKQLALRLAVFRSAQTYFSRFYNHEPWYITKLFHEEAIPSHAFQNVPKLWNKKYRPEAIYNLTTEGLYPEIFSALNKFLPEEFAYVRDLAMKSYAKGLIFPPWTAMQECSSCLIAAALDNSYQEKHLLRDIEKVEKRGQLIKEWRGIHIYSRLLPKNYFKCQLLAWLGGRKHPIWLEHWVSTEIMKAEYDRDKQKAVIEFKLTDENGMIRFGIRQEPSEVLVDGEKIKYDVSKKEKLKIELSSSGILELLFK